MPKTTQMSEETKAALMEVHRRNFGPDEKENPMGTLSQKKIQQKATEHLLSAEAIAHMLAVADPSIEQLDAFAVHAGTCGRLMAEHLSAAAEHLGNLTVD